MNRLILGLILVVQYIYSRKARCFLIPDLESGVSGEANFTQDDENSDIMVELKIYGANKIHGFHIHEKKMEKGCLSAGAHFNPFSQTHGGLESEIRHAGDMGNIHVTDGKNIIYSFTIPAGKMSLFGTNSIIDRTCVVHEKKDDEGKGENEESLKTGNSGTRLACGVVQAYDPVYSLIFGFCILLIGIGLSVYYFFFYIPKHNADNRSLKESEVKNI